MLKKRVLILLSLAQLKRRKKEEEGTKNKERKEKDHVPKKTTKIKLFSETVSGKKR